MEAILGLVFTFAFLILLFGGFQWIMAKFFGTHFHGKFGLGKAIQKHQEYELEVEKYSRTNPSLFNEAIERCNKKGYSRTHFNILSEIRKIESENENQPKLSEKISQKIKNVQDLIKPNNSLSEIEKLKKLNELRKEGGLSDEEYNSIKNKIISKDIKTVNNTDKDKKVVTENFDFAQMQKEQNINKALQTINTLYFEFKKDLDCLKNMSLSELHEIILKNGNTLSLINTYDNLFSLYTNGLITKDEFTNKKKQIITKSLNL